MEHQGKMNVNILYFRSFAVRKYMDCYRLFNVKMHHPKHFLISLAAFF